MDESFGLTSWCIIARDGGHEVAQVAMSGGLDASILAVHPDEASARAGLARLERAIALVSPQWRASIEHEIALRNRYLELLRESAMPPSPGEPREPFSGGGGGSGGARIIQTGGGGGSGPIPPAGEKAPPERDTKSAAPPPRPEEVAEAKDLIEESLQGELAAAHAEAPLSQRRAADLVKDRIGEDMWRWTIHSPADGSCPQVFIGDYLGPLRDSA